MIQVNSKENYPAYQINDLNDLDTFLVENIEDYDTIRAKDGRVRVTGGGGTILNFGLGDWLVVFSGKTIKNYSNDEFSKRFEAVA